MGGVSTPVTAKGEQTRRAILDAAILRFGRDGYRATSVADIARDAGVGGTVAYAYFPNKEALFLAALDEDAAVVITEGLADVLSDLRVDDWQRTAVFALYETVGRHPLARRVLSGLEPDVTDRVTEIPALNEVRKMCADRIRAEQLSGVVRDDIDPVAIGNGIVAIVISLLMSVLQVGSGTALAYAPDVAAVFEAALTVPPPRRA